MCPATAICPASAPSPASVEPLLPEAGQKGGTRTGPQRGKTTGWVCFAPCFAAERTRTSCKHLTPPTPHTATCISTLLVLPQPLLPGIHACTRGQSETSTAGCHLWCPRPQLWKGVWVSSPTRNEPSTRHEGEHGPQPSPPHPRPTAD